ncbi:flagellar FlbD family protein [Paludibaculum fermentans]|uniref:Flagellar FlbD family protein n=1 Tax=Paludibaculum fermentans TaxID=1473598 RepID=A0A7S7NS74_PALFE|nr:flagellar FlbD family protein [Paludibaculum fermentans]QOY88865.1 flagellar FlbD family protein [Paludibaculum fermentans]
MIRLTRLNLEPIVINSDLIECVESTPDTVLKLTNGQRLMVRESLDEVVARVIEYRRAIAAAPPASGRGGTAAALFAGESKHGYR